MYPFKNKICLAKYISCTRCWLWWTMRIDWWPRARRYTVLNYLHHWIPMHGRFIFIFILFRFLLLFLYVCYTCIWTVSFIRSSGLFYSECCEDTGRERESCRFLSYLNCLFFCLSNLIIWVYFRCSAFKRLCSIWCRLIRKRQIELWWCWHFVMVPFCSGIGNTQEKRKSFKIRIFSMLKLYSHFKTFFKLVAVFPLCCKTFILFVKLVRWNVVQCDVWNFEFKLNRFYRMLGYVSVPLFENFFNPIKSFDII